MTGWTLPWVPGSATGLGPFPGTDPLEAARVVCGELPDLPHLCELPHRGAGGDPAGRTASLLVDIHVDVHAGRWRVVSRPSGDERRAREMLERDLDALEDVASGHPGPVKIQVVGPWTLAATLELPRGEKMLADPGATRDLALSLAEGLARHVAEVRRRLARADRVLVQVDEPLLTAVLGGTVPSASGWDRMPVPEPGPAEQALAGVLGAAGGDPGVRCNVAGAPVAMLCRAGARFVAMDVDLLDTVPEEDVGEAVEAGTGFLVGLVPAPTAISPGPDLTEGVRRLWGRLGLSEEHLASVVVTPSVDLTALGPDDALLVLGRCRDAARSLRPGAEEDGPPAEEGERGLRRA